MVEGAKAMSAAKGSKSWRFDRRINASALVQITLLATLIVGSWVNLQRQLDLLQRDVTQLIESQKKFEQKVESLWSKSISHEYRLQSLEKQVAEVGISDAR
jgi:flagellar biosynthesis chaperone FliJ